ncbi:MAG TPA: L-histidine N(alpha)-methyltransferase [Acidimicrobiales bacterium]|nr:L-histidine N(alpha)-methyltransferase [Acidimicrobiales bacterium]
MKPRVDVRLSREDLKAALRADVAAGLVSEPKEVPPKWFYDERGSQLFDEITRLPEYYLTRAEREILDEAAHYVAGFTKADTLVEVGAGTSSKTRLLLDALDDVGSLRRFVPFDVCEGILRQAAVDIADEYPDLEVHAVVGDFEHHLHAIPGEGRRLFAFLGSTIGNLLPDARARFFAALSASMVPGDSLLLGTDLLKSPTRMVAAYDDSAGVTAEFNRNLLVVLNRELHADFEPEAFAHVARFEPEGEWVEMWLRADEAQVVVVDDLGLTVRFETAEAMRTEISAKFRRTGIEEELGKAELALGRWWTDSAGDFAVSLSFRE